MERPKPAARPGRRRTDPAAGAAGESCPVTAARPARPPELRRATGRAVASRSTAADAATAAAGDRPTGAAGGDGRQAGDARPGDGPAGAGGERPPATGRGPAAARRPGMTGRGRRGSGARVSREAARTPASRRAAPRVPADGPPGKQFVSVGRRADLGVAGVVRVHPGGAAAQQQQRRGPGLGAAGGPGADPVRPGGAGHPAAGRDRRAGDQPAAAHLGRGRPAGGAGRGRASGPTSWACWPARCRGAGRGCGSRSTG